MRLPKARNVIVAILVGVGIVAAGLMVAQDQESLHVRTSLAAEDPRFPAYLARLLGHSLTAENTVVVHTNGEAAFPAMLAAIDAAQHRVSFETYIFSAGDVGERFTTAFVKAAERGVDVRIVLDSLGAKGIDPAHVRRLDQAGIRVGWFNPVGKYYTLEEVNYRTHRKALVLDGEIAFVGGIGIADQWVEDAEDFPSWRDTQIELRGPVALDIEASFNENWIESGGIVEPVLVPHDLPRSGKAEAIAAWSSPEAGASATKLLYLISVAAARRTLDIQSPYFITDESSAWSLFEARRRGVRVRLLVEGDKTDAKPVKFASRSTYERYLAAGIEIYEYQPTMMHTKAVIIDDVMSIVGSANFDNRSFELNDELNVAIFDRPLAARLLKDFERDLTKSKRLEYNEWRLRPVHIKAREKLWSYFGEVF